MTVKELTRLQSLDPLPTHIWDLTPSWFPICVELVPSTFVRPHASLQVFGG
jgi:hypothetical protein